MVLMITCGHVDAAVERIAQRARAVARAACAFRLAVAARSYSGSPRISPVGASWAAAFILMVLTLCSCAHGDGIGAFIADPAMYDGYNCKQLAAQRDGLTTRQKQLRNLIDKADEGGGGTVIGALAYRSDYQKVLEQEKLLQRAGASRKCQFALPAAAPPQAPVTTSVPGPAAPAAASTYASDHTIH